MTKPEPVQVDYLDVGSMTMHVGDKVLYIPNHAENSDHPDCERGVITSLRSDGGVWVRYERQHITQPGQKTPVHNLCLL